MARLIRTEKEVEGRYEEVWLVVEEDALEQWPAGAREIVGQPVPRVDGAERARGEAIYTADLRVGLRFAESVRTGWVNINEGTNYWESHLPFGGRAGSNSGVGRVGGRFSMERLTELKTVIVNLG